MDHGVLDVATRVGKRISRGVPRPDAKPSPECFVPNIGLAIIRTGFWGRLQ